MKNEEKKWAKIRYTKELDSDELVEVTVDGSDAVAVFKGMAMLVKGCAKCTGLDVVGVLSRLTVILIGGAEET